MTVVVTGIGIVSALGANASQIWQRLLAGKSAIAVHQPFSQIPPCPLAVIGKHPALLDPLLIQATSEAIQAAQLSPPLAQCGVVIGSSRGYQPQWERFAASDSVHHWLDTLPHMGAVKIARMIDSQGPVLAPMAACATGLWAIAQGVDLIRTGQCQRVLVGAGEAALSPLTLTGFRQMRAMAETGCYPFDVEREGLVLGEGAAILVLESEATARSRSAHVYGRVLGIGLTADANHISAPDTASREGGIAAIKDCLHRSDLAPDQVDLIHAHGTSTGLNDAYEAELIQTLFPADVSVTATKGATGHTLGASGAIAAAICLLSLHHQLLPPCVGLKTPAFDLNLVRQAQPADISTALCFSFGFGGQNAIVAFGRDTDPSS